MSPPFILVRPVVIKKATFGYRKEKCVPKICRKLLCLSPRYISVDVTLQRLERHSFHSLRKITHM